ncbi:MAG: MBL fold metallo-hydrolase [Chamaesiphon sp. CSU_1_12]|nr:MBL fold metallo-hydrolase [Chamaesiphon sp. CSU_1_12]
MKFLHRPDLFCWSEFNSERNIDFHSIAWIRAAGNILIDPLPLSAIDLAHLQSLGGASWIVITNSDHIRASQEIAAKTGAQIAAPQGERATFPIAVDRWLADGDPVVPGLEAIELHGSKTPGELALLLEATTLIAGDLVRAHRAGSLMLLPDAKLVDRDLALASVRRLAELHQVETVLVGDGWHVFDQGHLQLQALCAK